MKILCVVALALAIATASLPLAEARPEHDPQNDQVQDSHQDDHGEPLPTTTAIPVASNVTGSEEGTTKSPSEDDEASTVVPESDGSDQAGQDSQGGNSTSTEAPSPSVTPSSKPDNVTEEEQPTDAPTTQEDETTENIATSTTAPVEPSTTSSPAAAPEPHGRHFDGWSFFGGIFLTVGLMTVGFVVMKYYKVRQGGNTFYNRF